MELLYMPVGYVQELYTLAVEESKQAQKNGDYSKAAEAMEDEIGL